MAERLDNSLVDIIMNDRRDSVVCPLWYQASSNTNDQTLKSNLVSIRDIFTTHLLICFPYKIKNIKHHFIEQNLLSSTVHNFVLIVWHEHKGMCNRRVPNGKRILNIKVNNDYKSNNNVNKCNVCKWKNNFDNVET